MPEPIVDKQIVCVECEQLFTFTAGEQQYFKEQKFTDPKRCKPCRLAKKERNKAREAERDGGGKQS